MHPDFGAPGCAAGTAATPSSPCFRSCSHPPAVSAGKLCKTKSSTHFHTLNFFGGRGWITRAAHLKKPRRGFFPAGLFGGSMLFSSTLVVRYKVQIKQKLQRHNNAGVLGGRGWIRTTEAESSRFTVCPHWPLGNTPIFFCVRHADCLYILPRAKQFVNHLQQILSQFLHQSLQQTRPMEKPPGNQCSRAVFLGAGDRS